MKILIVDDIKGWIDYHSLVVKKMFPASIVETAESAREAYHKILMNVEDPYQIILTDMQMENDFEPKYAGEWLIEQIKSLPSYSKSNIVLATQLNSIIPFFPF